MISTNNPPRYQLLSEAKNPDAWGPNSRFFLFLVADGHFNNGDGETVFLFPDQFETLAKITGVEFGFDAAVKFLEYYGATVVTDWTAL